MRFWLGILALLLAGCLLDHFEERGKGRMIVVDCRDPNLQPRDSTADTSMTCDATGGD